MKIIRHLPTRSVGFFILISAVALLSIGCSDSTTDPGTNANPMSVFQPDNAPTGLPTNGTTQGVGAIDTPVITLPLPNDGRQDHTNAPLLDNMHPGWQQAECLSCHTDQSRIPDHSYPDTTLCYLCHGTNGLPGFGDNIPPIIKNVVAAPGKESVLITWSTDEPCITRLILRTTAGDKLEFPVSTDYSMSHKYGVDGLLTSTTYEYEIQAIDRNNNKTTSATFGKLYFTTAVQSSTPGGTTGPTPTPTNFVNGPTMVEVNTFDATANWTTREASTCVIEAVDMQWGTNQRWNAGGPKTDFTFKMTSLVASHPYKVFIYPTDINGQALPGTLGVPFTTKPVPQ